MTGSPDPFRLPLAIPSPRSRRSHSLQPILVDGEVVQILGPRAFRVKSGSQDDVWYAVSLEERDGRGVCTCRGFEIRKACRHLAAVQGFVTGSAVTAADEPLRVWEGELATSRYQSGEVIVRSGLVPVRITGHPRFALKGYRVAAKVMEAAPKGLDVDGDEFTRSYRKRLESFGVAYFQRRFAEILREHKGAGLVLLCYEDVSKPGVVCHRRLFADWWRERTGQDVPELGVAVQATLA